ncbi:nuclear transport factor 2 family protein [Nocardia sp. NPDC051463]|uniref:nuclear transport factor 2 family protein n=1 Tax=Nocardia sp. NPDC051463 TaxID=3154845 RepID=UPI00342B270A
MTDENKAVVQDMWRALAEQDFDCFADYFADDFPRLFMENVAMTCHGIYAEGDRVIVEHTMSATLANGDPYLNNYCFVFELREVAEGEIPESAQCLSLRTPTSGAPARPLSRARAAHPARRTTSSSFTSELAFCEPG